MAAHAQAIIEPRHRIEEPANEETNDSDRHAYLRQRASQ